MNQCYFLLIVMWTMSIVFNGCEVNSSKSNKRKLPKYDIPTNTIISHDTLLKKSCSTWYDTTLANKGFSGGFLVAKDGQIIMETYAGSYGNKQLIQANTPIHIASTSKTFTAMCILKLCGEKKIKLEELFSHYFPEFNYPGVTISSLLNHRSGLPNYVHFVDKIEPNKKKMISNTDILHYLIQFKSQLTDIGTPNKNFRYCNTNYVLLALLIEKITGQSFPHYLKEQIFNPLGMHNSFVLTDSTKPRATPSYYPNGKIYETTNLDATYGDKNIYSTPQDMLKWDQLLRSGQFLDSNLLKLAYTPYSQEIKGNKNYGLGWRMELFPNNYKLIFHNGWWHGNNSVFIRMIPENVTIVVLGNKYNKMIYDAKLLTNLFNTTLHIQPEPEETNTTIEPTKKTNKRVKRK